MFEFFSHRGDCIPADTENTEGYLIFFISVHLCSSVVNQA